MPGPLQKASAEEDWDTGVWVLAGMWEPDDWVLPCRLRCRGGGRRSRWPAPRGWVWASWIPGEGFPPLTRAQPPESLLSNIPQAVGLPPPVLKAGWHRFQTSVCLEVARSNSLILGE